MPVILKMSPVDKLWHSGIIFGVIYTVISGLLGYYLKQKGFHGLWLLIFPILFAVGIWLSGPKYALFFAVVYLCVSYLTNGLSRNA